MTKVDEVEVKKSEGINKRLNRRNLLKAGAVAAPVALTLHGGVPLAHADSSGACVVQLMDIAKSNDPRAPMLQVPIKKGGVATPIRGYHETELLPENLERDYPKGTKLEPFDGSYTHWDFVADPKNNRFGYSCVSSIGYKKIQKIRAENGIFDAPTGRRPRRGRGRGRTD